MLEVRRGRAAGHVVAVVAMLLVCGLNPTQASPLGAEIVDRAVGGYVHLSPTDSAADPYAMVVATETGELRELFVRICNSVSDCSDYASSLAPGDLAFSSNGSVVSLRAEVPGLGEVQALFRAISGGTGVGWWFKQNVRAVVSIAADWHYEHVMLDASFGGWHSDRGGFGVSSFQGAIARVSI